MSLLELKVPPVLVTLIFAILSWILASATPSLSAALPRTWRTMLVAGLLTAGVIIIAAGVRAFRQSRTTVNPLRPESSESLVTSGIYGVTRNPMYLGFLSVLAAWTVWLGHLTGPVLLLLYVMYITRYQIIPEERVLSRIFGAEFETYRRTVRRWL